MRSPIVYLMWLSGAGAVISWLSGQYPFLWLPGLVIFAFTAYAFALHLR